jgi:hypothetical protein
MQESCGTNCDAWFTYSCCLSVPDASMCCLPSPLCSCLRLVLASAVEFGQQERVLATVRVMFQGLQTLAADTAHLAE